MATLEDKILGEKLEYYCSSDEDNDSDYELASEETPSNSNTECPLEQPQHSQHGTSNTGPKGVIKDWQRYKQLETERREEQEREKISLAQKLSLTCRSTQDDELSEDPELADLLTDPFFFEYTQLRMQELLAKTSQAKNFGKVLYIKSGDEYLEAIDKENEKVSIILHVFEDSNALCKIMNLCLDELSANHKAVKFCKMSASAAGLSRHFKKQGVPALLIYKGGQLIGNFVGLREEFGDEFTSNDVENFLIEKGILMDVPQCTAPS